MAICQIYLTLSISVENFLDFHVLNQIIATKIVRVSCTEFRCTDCDHVSSQRGNMINHVEARHVVTEGILCHICQKHSPTRQAYRMHMVRVHNIVNVNLKSK